MPVAEKRDAEYVWEVSWIDSDGWRETLVYKSKNAAVEAAVQIGARVCRKEVL